MRYQVCSVFDETAHEFTGLTLEISEPAALRSFASSIQTSIAKQTGLFFTHTKDFSLWKLGELDSSTGDYYPDQRLIVRATEV